MNQNQNLPANNQQQQQPQQRQPTCEDQACQIILFTCLSILAIIIQIFNKHLTDDQIYEFKAYTITIWMFLAGVILIGIIRLFLRQWLKMDAKYITGFTLSLATLAGALYLGMISGLTPGVERIDRQFKELAPLGNIYFYEREVYKEIENFIAQDGSGILLVYGPPHSFKSLKLKRISYEEPNVFYFSFALHPKLSDFFMVISSQKESTALESYMKKKQNLVMIFDDIHKLPSQELQKLSIFAKRVYDDSHKVILCTSDSMGADIIASNFKYFGKDSDARGLQKIEIGKLSLDQLRQYIKGGQWVQLSEADIKYIHINLEMRLLPIWLKSFSRFDVQSTLKAQARSNLAAVGLPNIMIEIERYVKFDRTLLIELYKVLYRELKGQQGLKKSEAKNYSNAMQNLLDRKIFNAKLESDSVDKVYSLRPEFKDFFMKVMTKMFDYENVASQKELVDKIQEKFAMLDRNRVTGENCAREQTKNCPYEVDQP